MVAVRSGVGAGVGVAPSVAVPVLVGISIGDEEGFTTRAKWDELKRFTTEALAVHHREQPLVSGLEMEALRTRLPYEVAPRAFRGSRPGP